MAKRSRIVWVLDDSDWITIKAAVENYRETIAGALEDAADLETRMADEHDMDVCKSFANKIGKAIAD